MRPFRLIQFILLVQCFIFLSPLAWASGSNCAHGLMHLLMTRRQRIDAISLPKIQTRFAIEEWSSRPAHFLTPLRFNLGLLLTHRNIPDWALRPVQARITLTLKKAGKISKAVRVGFKEQGENPPEYGIVSASNDQLLLVRVNQGKLRWWILWDASSNRVYRIQHPSGMNPSRVQSLAFNPEGNLLIYDEGDGIEQFADLKGILSVNKRYIKLSEHPFKPPAVATSRRNRFQP